MAGFSIDTALKSGFALAKREPLAVLIWGIGYSLAGLLVQAVAIGSALPQYLSLMQRDPEAAAGVMEQAIEANALVAAPIMFALGLLAAAVFYGAVVRALLQPQARGFFYLRVSAREMWLALTAFVLTLGAVAAIMVATFAFGMLGSLAGAWGLLLTAPVVAGLLYLAARFSTACIQAFDEQRLVVMDAWRLTRGQGWRLVLMLLALVFLLLIVAAVVLIPLGIVASILIGVASMAGGVGGGAVVALVAVLSLVLLSAIYGLFMVVATAPYVEVYRSLKGLGPTDRETAEAFA